MLLFFDCETYSEADLPKVGAHNYAAHPSTELLLVAYALDAGPVQLWDITDASAMPDDLAGYLTDPSILVVAHNSQFDRLVMQHQAGLFCPPQGRWRDSMVKGLLHGFPGKLDSLGVALGLPEDQRKLAIGRRLINRFCKPTPANHNVRRYTRHTHPEEWRQFRDYAVQDVAAMRALWNLIPDWNHSETEIALWLLDQEINDYGFLADRELAEAGAAAADYEQLDMARRMKAITQGAVAAPTQREKLLNYLNANYQLGLSDLTKATVTQALADEPGIPEAAAELLRIRQASGKTSTAKYATLRDALSPDDRFRGGIQFSGAARTRRAAGRKFQAQNLPSRGIPKPEIIDQYIGALKRGHHELIFDDLMLLGSAAIRGLIIAPPGKQLVVSDLSNIEGRIVAWLAGERWKLDAFRDFDAGTGPDLYNITAVSIIGGDPWKVAKQDRNSHGKVPELACFAADTRVLTDHGHKRIVEVLLTDRLWDGTEWVQHQGVLDKNVRRVVNVDGISVTPDHLIKTGATWTPARQLVMSKSILSLALVTGSANLPSWDSFLGRKAVSKLFKFAVPAAHWCTVSLRQISDTVRARAARLVRSRPLVYNVAPGSGTAALSQTMRTGGDYLIGLRLALAGAKILRTLCGKITEAGVLRFLPNGSMIKNCFFSILRRYPAGIIQNCNWTESITINPMYLEICVLRPLNSSSAINGQIVSSITKANNFVPKISGNGSVPDTHRVIPLTVSCATANPPKKLSTSNLRLHAENTGQGQRRLWSCIKATNTRLINFINGIVRRISGPEMLFGNLQNGSVLQKKPFINSSPTTKARVFDIRECGPRNCFTVISDSGALIAHNCGFGGGAGALQTFAKGYNVKMADHWPRLQETAPQHAEKAQENWADWGADKAGDLPQNEWLASETVKLAWRARHPATTQLWKSLETAAYAALDNPGTVHAAGPLLKMMASRYGGELWLRTKLPSGRYVTYFEPQIEDRGWSYLGVDTRQGSPTKGLWVRLYNYGGRTLEQATQATARDVLYDSMPAAMAAGFRIVMHVHDELVTEADPDKNALELSGILSAGHLWTTGLPLAAAGFECQRYCKG